MGPFTFEQYHNPYVQSISQLMLAPAQAQAQAAQTIGEAQARAAQQRGQAWGGAAQNIGQIVGNLPSQIQRAQQQSTVDQLGKIRLENEQRDQAGGKAVAGLMEGDQLPAGEAGPRKQSYLGADGLYDISALSKALGASGFGDKAPELLKSAENINASIVEHQKTQQQLANEHTKMLGFMADGAQKLAMLGMPLDQALDFVGQPAVTTGRLKPEEFAAAKQQLLQLPPDQQKLGLQSLMDAAAKISPTKTHAADSSETDIFGRVIAEGPKKPGEGQHVVNGQIVGPNGERIGAPVPPQATPGQAETERHNKEMERISALTQGRQAAAERETERHNKITEAALNPMGALFGGAGQRGATDQPPTVTGDEFLKQLPPDIGTQVKALAEGRMAFPSSFALKTPYWQQMLQAVSQYDPSFDAINYNTRASTRKAFSSGKQSQDVNALNTVISHMDKLSDAAEALNNTNYPQLNSVLNALSKAVGKPTVTNFETIQKAVADEVTRVWRQSGGSVEDIAAARANLDAAKSPDQLRGAIAQYGELLGGKIQSMQEQYQQGMGKASDANATLIRPDTQKTLEKIAGRVTGTEQPKPQAQLKGTAPDNVKSALSGKGAGRYTLSDGSQWVIDGTGTIRPGS